ncbi:MAG: bifunctional glutamate N-acetyltransferase/amino-acid acetyltransferase ArgJ [Verrucomicrobia bacterium]|nr:bifunctional glutamate N-acetyltransferase/amino-acid acetyltransferase ArgJ [Verrucomicrobiota bacterium]
MKMKIENDATLPSGFRAAGLHVGLKKSGASDMALLVSDTPATVAAVFTSNQIKAAPVKWCMARAASRKGRAVVINSGNANCCTGEKGLRDAAQMAEWTASELGVKASDVYVCSTGSIGFDLDMKTIGRGIPRLAEALSPQGGEEAAQGIMTTDNAPKFVTTSFKADGKTVRVTGIAKGAGMIEPNMATMLCFLMTDAAVAPSSLQKALKSAVNESFNRISVDGDQSTNDTVLCFANGASGSDSLKPGHPGWAAFEEALLQVARVLAWKMIRDGEGADKVIKVEVTGAGTAKDAELAARSVANSLLVKTSWHGTNPKWGRVMDALGYSPARVDESKVSIAYDGVVAVRNGIKTKASPDRLKKIHSQERFTITIDLGLGKGASYVFGCDCAHKYIDINI